jgi:hypothetical protein
VLAALLLSLPAAIWSGQNRKNIFLKFAASICILFIAGFSVKWIDPLHDPLKLLSIKQNEFVKSASGGTYLYNDSIVAVLRGDQHDALIKKGDSLYAIREGTPFYYMPANSNFTDSFPMTSHSEQVYKLYSDDPRAGSFMQTNLLQPNLKSFLSATPRALLRVLFRPFIREGKNPILLLPAIENLFFILLLFCALFFHRKILSPEIFGFCMVFSVALLLVMGLTTPVLGALVRYRIAAQPFLYFAILLCIDRDKLIAKWKFAEKF